MEKIYFYVYNRPEGMGVFKERDAADIWRPNENENGWTRQSVEAGGLIVAEAGTLEKCREIAEKKGYLSPK